MRRTQIKTIAVGSNIAADAADTNSSGGVLVTNYGIVKTRPPNEEGAF